MTRSPIRTALVGYGLAGKVFHAPLVTANDDYSLDAIVTSDRQRAADASGRYPAARILSDTDQLLAASDSYDLVIIAAPTPSHAALATRTIERSLATVVDKPLAVHVADAERIIASAEDRGVPLTVFQNRRWDGDFLTIRRLIDTGRLVDVTRFESRFEWLNPRPRPAWKSGTSGVDGGGVAYDLGSHLVDQAIRLFGAVADVYGELDRRGTDAVNDDDSFIALTHESGVRSHLTMSSRVAQRGFRFRALGEGSAFTKWGLDPQEAQLAAGLSPLDPAYAVEGRNAYGLLGRDDDLTDVPTEVGRYPEFYALLADALSGSGALPVEPRDSIPVIAIIEQLQRDRR